MNRKFTALIVSMLLTGLLATGCTPGAEGNPASTSKPEASPVPAAVPEASPAPIEAEDNDSISEFSVVSGTKGISLEDWDNRVDLSDILGKAASEETKILDHTSDTFAGSYVKKLIYDGLELELFSPKDNGKAFWIKAITITGGNYITPQGASVGSSIEELKEKYPEIQQHPDGRKDPDNCAYIYKDETGFSNMLFEVKDGKTVSIRIYKEMP